MRINDSLLNALADRWPHIMPDYRGQTFEAWLESRMNFYNAFGYPLPGSPYCEGDLPPSLWQIVQDTAPACQDDYVVMKSEELRATGGTFVQAIWDLTPLARLMLGL